MDKDNMDKDNMDIPHFVVTEHTIKKNNQLLYERREAKVFVVDDDLQIYLQITRSVDNRSVVFVISRAGSSESRIHEQTTLSRKQLAKFKEDWETLWQPIFPKDDTLSPLMLQITTLQPNIRKPKALREEEQPMLKQEQPVIVEKKASNYGAAPSARKSVQEDPREDRIKTLEDRLALAESLIEDLTDRVSRLEAKKKWAKHFFSTF